MKFDNIVFQTLVLRALWMLVWEPARRETRARQWQVDAVSFLVQSNESTYDDGKQVRVNAKAAARIADYFEL